MSRLWDKGSKLDERVLRYTAGEDHALDNGVKQSELSEVITHLAFYSGWPTAMSAMMIAKDVFKERESAA